MPRGQYDRAASAWTPKPKREYDAQLVERLVGMYEAGMTIRMCTSCHRRFDAARRAATGMNTMPARR